ncbi:hypothetical protein N7520_005058 [Penicillium odoratum]|uniref:uncharacterized protein n=1 Tax=Penicillium odoratum TaxID=1167516 RepID=UPI0025499FC7|nr:uncharacterized protein N7520_005058 [Penicillium odoratum]KAJ5765499.1 hypothetical protein N7520_005058 [Penicillium odoratum]
MADFEKVIVKEARSEVQGDHYFWVSTDNSRLSPVLKRNGKSTVVILPQYELPFNGGQMSITELAGGVQPTYARVKPSKPNVDK